MDKASPERLLTRVVLGLASSYTILHQPLWCSVTGHISVNSGGFKWFHTTLHALDGNDSRFHATWDGGVHVVRKGVETMDETV